MANEPILQVDHLFVTLDVVPILQDVSFHLNQGEAVAVIGPTGAGKTVLFRSLLGLVPYAGAIGGMADYGHLDVTSEGEIKQCLLP